VLQIRHCLVGVEDVSLEQIRVVRSHPAALDQCRRLLAAMPWATAIAAGTTAEAAAEVAASGDPTEAAIAGERAAQLHGLRVIAGDVGDHTAAYTRFVSVTTFPRLDRSAEDWRTAFSFVTDHRPGALHRAIEPFARHGIDLVQLVSRPIPDTPWRYCFHAVLAGHPLDTEIRGALAEVQAGTRRLKVFGSYSAARSRS
jgi:chorismate mutase / prephenate dehydratase